MHVHTQAVRGAGRASSPWRMSTTDELAGPVTLIYLNVDTNVFGHRCGGSRSTGVAFWARRPWPNFCGYGADRHSTWAANRRTERNPITTVEELHQLLFDLPGIC